MRIQSLAVVLATMFVFGVEAQTTRTWTGASNGNWSVAGNWSPSGVPANGDTLIFDNTATGYRTNSNDIAGLAIAEIQVLAGGYSIGGNAVTVSNAVSVSVATNSASIISLVMAGPAGLTKSDGGTLTVTGANSYSGGTTVSAGILRTTATAGFGSGAVTLGDANTGANDIQVRLGANNVANAIIVSSNGTGSVTLFGEGQYQVHTGAITLNRAAVFDIGAHGSTGTDWWFAFANTGGISGTGTAIIKGGLGGSTAAATGNRIVFNANNTYSGGTVIESGKLQLGGANSAGTGAITLGDANTGSAVTQLRAGANITNAVVISSAAGAGSVPGIATYNSLQIFSGPLQIDHAVELDGGSDRLTWSGTNAIWSGSGSVTINGGRVTHDTAVNGWSGNMAINASSIFQPGHATSLNASNSVSVTGTLQLNNVSQSINGLTGAGTVKNIVGANTLTVGVGGAAGSFSGVIQNGSGTMTLVKAGAGTQSLSGTNSYTGATAINGGTLQLAGGGNRLPTGTVMTLADANGATLDLNGFNQTIAGLAGGGASGGNIALSNGVLTVSQSTNTVYGGVINGSGSLALIGSGKLTLAGANTYSGGTTISNGVLEIVGSLVGDVVNNGVLVFNSASALTFNGNITGSGSVVQTGAGLLTLGGMNTYTGATVVSGGGLQVTGAASLSQYSDLTVNSSLNLYSSGTAYTATIRSLSGSGNVTVADANGGAFNLTVGAGGGAGGFYGKLLDSTTTSATLAFTKTGTGDQTISGSGNTYSGGTTTNDSLLTLQDEAAMAAYGSSTPPPSCGSPNDSTPPDCKSITTKSVTPVNVQNADMSTHELDLALLAGAGEHRLNWERTSNSRLIDGNQWFGQGQMWRHSYQWEMADSGANQKTIHYPDGNVRTYAFNGTAWVAALARNPDVLTESGSTYTLTRANGWRYIFNAYNDGQGVYYLMEQFLDSSSNVYTLSYDSAHKLTQVTEPGGRFLQVAYEDIQLNESAFNTVAGIGGTPAAGWNTINISDTNQYRYLRYYIGGAGFGQSYCTVAEVEFYDQNGNKLYGTPIGTGPSYNDDPNLTFDKAFDGNTNTYCNAQLMHFGFTGIDLGPGRTARISKIRYCPAAGYEGRMYTGQFQGGNVAPQTQTVIAGVTGSDGRGVTYSYATKQDRVLASSWLTLTGAGYGDGTAAQYQYYGLWPGQRPVLSSSVSPRIVGKGTQVKYTYWVSSGVYGQIYQLQNGVNGALLTKIEGMSGGNWGSTMIKVTRGDGGTELFSWGNGGDVTSKMDALNRVEVYTYSAGGYGFLATSRDALNRTTSYVRDSQGRVLQTTYPDGSVEGWTRNALGAPLTHTNELGYVTAWTYDASNRVTRVDYPDSSFETFAYNSFGQVTTNVLRNGGSVISTYDARGLKTAMRDAEGNWTYFGYDAADRLADVQDARGNVTSYTYNDRGQVTTVTNADSTVARNFYDTFGNVTNRVDELGHATATTYDEFNRVLTQADALGRTTTYAYGIPGGGCGCASSQAHPTSVTDANNHTTQFGYDIEWQQISVTDPLNNVTVYTYDAAGNRKTQTDANNHTTAWAYDSRNRVSAITNALGYVTSYQYDAVGNRTRQIDGNGKYTYWQYDVDNQVIAEIRKAGDTSPTPDGNDAVTSYTYDIAGNRLAITDPNNNTTAYAYDLLNRQVASTNGVGDVTQTVYDSVGNVASSIAPNGNVTANSYDSRNRLTNVVDSVGFVAAFGYYANGQRAASMDGNGNVTQYGYDAANQLVAVIDPLSQVTSNYYDNAGNLLATVDRNGQPTTYAYDADNRRVAATNALNEVTLSTYDAVGNLVALTDANNHTTSYGYDALNRRTSETYPDAAPNTKTFTYDAMGNVLTKTDQKGLVQTSAYNDLYYLLSRSTPGYPTDSFTYDVGGRMLSATRNGWVVGYTYDAANRVTQTTQGGQTVGYAYNTAARTRTMTYPNGRVVVETKDLRDRLYTVGDTGGVITTYAYDNGNRVGTRTYANGAVASYAYDADNRITSLDHVKSGTRIAGFTHAYDNEGNKLYEQKLHQSTNSEAYAYDNIYRLTDYRVGTLSGNTIPSPATETGWNLDPVGNWNSKTTDSVTESRNHNAANEITAIDSVAIGHDANGNLTNDTTQAYAYDENNRLVSVSTLGAYSYDALGRRISKTTTNGQTCFFYDGARIIEEQACSGGTLATYTYGDYIDEVLTKDAGSARYFYHQNTLWSVHVLTDASGNVVERYSYDAYGKLSVLDASYQLLATAPLAYFTYTGREFDFESGAYHYRARNYSPSLGRFLSRDPLGYVDGLNLYQYVRDNPINLYDSTGYSAAKNASWSAKLIKGPIGIADGVVGFDISIWNILPEEKAWPPSSTQAWQVNIVTLTFVAKNSEFWEQEQGAILDVVNITPNPKQIQDDRKNQISGDYCILIEETAIYQGFNKKGKKLPPMSSVHIDIDVANKYISDMRGPLGTPTEYYVYYNHCNCSEQFRKEYGEINYEYYSYEGLGAWGDTF